MYKKIPENARMVFKGVLHDVYQWDQKMFDGSTEVFESIKKRDTVTVVAIVGDRIIINSEEHPNREPFRALPGGKCEGEDSLLENAKRELNEETGYESNDWEKWFVSDILDQWEIDWNDHFFVARNCQKINNPKLDPGEKIETELVTFEEFLELRNIPEARNKNLFPILEKASEDEKEKAILKNFLFKTNN